MKITEYAPIGKSAAPRRKSAVSDSGMFSGALDAASTQGAGAASASTPASPLAEVGELLALQEVMDGGGNASESATLTASNQALNALEELKLALLQGSVPEQLMPRLRAITRMASLGAAYASPALTLVWQDITLRAAVELAKLERAVQKQENT